VFWFSTGGVVVSLAGMLLVDTEPMFSTWTLTTWLLSICQAVLALLGTSLILKTLCWITPTKNKVIRSFQVVVSYIIQGSKYNMENNVKYKYFFRLQHLELFLICLIILVP
jgi:hypothetical protein